LGLHRPSKRSIARETHEMSRKKSFLFRVFSRLSRAKLKLPIILRVSEYQIITFYEFKRFAAADLERLQDDLKASMREHSIKGTIILASEGFNATVAGTTENIKTFITAAESILKTTVNYKSSYHQDMPFHRVDVKIKPEIVTLKRHVDISFGDGTHVDPKNWNENKQRVVSNKQTTKDGDHSLNDLLKNLKEVCEKAYKDELKAGIPSPPKRTFSR